MGLPPLETGALQVTVAWAFPAVALSVGAPPPLDEEERRPDQQLRLQFEAARRLNPEQKRALAIVLEGILLQQQHAESVQRLAQVS